MKKNSHKQYSGKMDRTSKRKYKTTYRMGYGKLKHVGLFENFDNFVVNETAEMERLVLADYGNLSMEDMRKVLAIPDEKKNEIKLAHGYKWFLGKAGEERFKFLAKDERDAEHAAAEWNGEVIGEVDENMEFETEPMDECRIYEKKTWKEFMKGKMGKYMKSEGSHGAAIRKIAKEWKVYKKKNNISESRLNETGEWSRDMDWNAVKGMTDEEIGRDDEATWIKELEEMIGYIEDMGAELEIQDIQGFDKYLGPYATVEFKKGMNKGTYKVWMVEHEELFVENYPDGNIDRGFVGTAEEIANLFN